MAIPFKEVLGRVKRILSGFQKNVKGASRVFQGCFKEVLRVFHANFKVVSEVLQRRI